MLPLCVGDFHTVDLESHGNLIFTEWACRGSSCLWGSGRAGVWFHRGIASVGWGSMDKNPLKPLPCAAWENFKTHIKMTPCPGPCRCADLGDVLVPGGVTDHPSHSQGSARAMCPHLNAHTARPDLLPLCSLQKPVRNIGFLVLQGNGIALFPLYCCMKA